MRLLPDEIAGLSMRIRRKGTRGLYDRTDRER